MDLNTAGNLASLLSLLTLVPMLSRWGQNMVGVNPNTATGTAPAKRGGILRIVFGLVALTAIGINSYVLWNATGHHLAFPREGLKSVTNCNISNQVVVLDGHDYEHCTFRNVTIEYDGGEFAFSYNQIYNPQFKTQNDDLRKGIIFMVKMGLAKGSIRDPSTGHVIEPGATWLGP
jgi:hypothetical protein